MPPSLVIAASLPGGAARVGDNCPLPGVSRSRSGPVARLEEIGIELFLGRPGRGLPVVAPGGLGRHRHEDRFAAAARLEAEQSAAVIHQVEFDVAPAAVELEVALTVPERRSFPLIQDRQIGGQERVAHRACEAERKIEIALREIVEEDAANAARLVTVLQMEIAVAPGLEPRVVVLPERIEG